MATVLAIPSYRIVAVLMRPELILFQVSFKTNSFFEISTILCQKNRCGKKQQLKSMKRRKINDSWNANIPLIFAMKEQF